MRKVRPRDLADDVRERMVWGENGDHIHKIPDQVPAASQGENPHKDVCVDLDDQELSFPSSGHRRKHDYYPSRGLRSASMGSPNISPSPRRRPRGSDAGKSIHKAAEASQLSQVSPGLSVNQKLDRHLSTSAGKHNTTPVERREGRISVYASPGIARKSGFKASSQARLPKRKAGSCSGDESNDRPPVMGSGGHQASERLTSTRDRGRPQVARKSASKVGKHLKKDITKVSPALRQMPTKAARKFPSRCLPRDFPPADFSGSSSENSSDDDSLSSFESSEISTSSGTSVKGCLGEDIDSRLDVSLSPLPVGSPGEKGTASNNRGGLGSHGHNSPSKSPLPSRHILGIDSHDAKVDNSGKLTPAGPRCAEIKSPGSNLKFRTQQHSPPSGRSTRTHNSLKEITSPHKHEYPPASTSPRDCLPAGTSSRVPTTGEAAPPPPLVDAFENLLAYPLYLHRTNRLPFLLRNIRASFRSWCRDLGIPSQSEANVGTTAYPQVPLTYEYISASGGLYTYETTHPTRECPLCSLFGRFSGWETLRKHVRWDHSEIECDLIPDEIYSKLVVRMKEHGHTTSSPVMSSKSDRSNTACTKRNPSLEDVTSVLEAVITPPEEHAYSPRPSPDILSRSQSPSRSTSTTFQKATTSNEVSISSHIATPDAAPESDEIRASSPHILTTPVVSSPRLTLPPTSPRSRPPTPPPIFYHHGPAHPIVTDPKHPLARVQPITYRPTGPHLYDHLSSLPLEVFGHQSWFILDKEEEIFELTDVLDEDKVICALWGRWILLNRPFFIGNYLAGVEAFIDEYWLIIHQAAGWGALRAWLLVLVSRRFLTLVELIQVLKKYNELVGKDKWLKS